MAAPLLIVGLGNPGREYAATRHNVGWMALDELAPGASYTKKFSAEFARTQIEGRDAVLLKPLTYMNESGRSVGPAMAFFHVPIGDIVVLHDELDLPFGEVRLKIGGGAAGHNGIKSLIQALPSGDFVRVRMGIGRPPPDFAGSGADFVLASFTSAERPEVPGMVHRAAETVRRLAAVGVERAMNELHTRPRAAPERPRKAPEGAGRKSGG